MVSIRRKDYRFPCALRFCAKKKYRERSEVCCRPVSRKPRESPSFRDNVLLMAIVSDWLRESKAWLAAENRLYHVMNFQASSADGTYEKKTMYFKGALAVFNDSFIDQFDSLIRKTFAPKIKPARKSNPSLLLACLGIGYMNMLVYVRLHDHSTKNGEHDFSAIFTQLAILRIDQLVCSLMQPVRNGQGILDAGSRPGLILWYLYLSRFYANHQHYDLDGFTDNSALLEQVWKCLFEFFEELKDDLQVDCQNGDHGPDEFITSQRGILRELQATKTWDFILDLVSSESPNYEHESYDLISQSQDLNLPPQRQCFRAQLDLDISNQGSRGFDRSFDHDIIPPIQSMPSGPQENNLLQSYQSIGYQPNFWRHPGHSFSTADDGWDQNPPPIYLPYERLPTALQHGYPSYVNPPWSDFSVPQDSCFTQASANFRNHFSDITNPPSYFDMPISTSHILNKSGSISNIIEHTFFPCHSVPPNNRLPEIAAPPYNSNEPTSASGVLNKSNAQAFNSFPTDPNPNGEPPYFDFTPVPKTSSAEHGPMTMVDSVHDKPAMFDLEKHHRNSQQLNVSIEPRLPKHIPKCYPGQGNIWAPGYVYS